MTINAIEINALRKTYRSSKGDVKEALRGVDLQVPEGSMFGLLGANGAGKSTLINIMADLVLKTSGSVKISGYDIDTQMRSARCAIGIVPQELVLDTFFTVRQALEIHAGYYGIAKKYRRTDEIIAAMGLEDKADIHARRLSGGMRRRLLIAKALVHSPKILVLDEPTAGVDVELRTQLWEYVKQLNKQGTTVLLTTHYLEEAETLCDRIAIINNGELVACEDKKTLMQGVDSKQLFIQTKKTLDSVPDILAQDGWRLDNDGGLVISYQPSNINIELLLSKLRANGVEIHDIRTQEAKLEDVFLKFTKAS